MCLLEHMWVLSKIHSTLIQCIIKVSMIPQSHNPVNVKKSHRALTVTRHQEPVYGNYFKKLGQVNVGTAVGYFH